LEESVEVGEMLIETVRRLLAAFASVLEELPEALEVDPCLRRF
jgi:hypothetical protein